MSELFKNGQIFSIIPQDFRNANKGEVVEYGDKTFTLKVIHPPVGILINNLIEFYSQTPHGVLYFQSDVLKIEGNLLFVENPVKHRFLQRRQFTRVKFNQELDLTVDEKPYSASTFDLSAGGMKLKTYENIDIDSEYDVRVRLSSDQEVFCKYQPIRIEKGDEKFYTVSGRFKNLSNVDKMTLVQFCMKKNLELVNK